MGLKEPYLQTVILRFYEDKQPQQIAEIMGVSIATVRSRIQRAKSQLQTKLESEFGGSFKSMSLALLPLLPPRSSGLVSVTAGAALIGKATMGFKAKAGVAALGLACMLGWYASGLDGETSEVDTQSPEIVSGVELSPPDSGSKLAPEAPYQAPDPGSRKGLAQEDRPQPITDVTVEEPTEGLFGRVLHQGKPLAGVEVTQYLVSVDRLIDFRTGENVVGRIRPIDRVIRSGQPGYSMLSATPVDQAVDGVLPEDFRSYKIVKEAPVVTTDGDGRFQFIQFPTKSFSLGLKHAELDLALQTDPILASSQELHNAGDLDILPAVTLVGRLTFDHALTLAGHFTTIKGLPGYSATSDGDGNFEMRGIPAGEHMLRVALSEGVYRPKWDQGFFVRLGKDPLRKVTLATESEPCSLLSLEVTHNGAPYSNESIRIHVRGKNQRCYIELDEQGKGIGTVPRNVALQPTARFEGYSDGITIAADLFITRQEHFAKLDIQTGSLELRFPYSCIPAPETSLVDVQVDIEGAQAVRFDQLFGPDGHPVQLDESGFAQVRVPAWLSVGPCFQNAGGVWIHIETIDVMFPAGTAEFQMVWDKAKGGIALTGHNPMLRKETKKRAPLYRMLLEWANPLTQEVESETRKINPGRLAAKPQPIESILFPGLPVGPMALTVHLQRKGGDWKTMQTWKKAIEVQPGANAVQVTVGE